MSLQQDNVRLRYDVSSSGQKGTKDVDSEWESSKQDDPSADPASEVPSKRRRVALACNVCRARKSRCDGARPKCSLCIELGFDCRYQQSSSYSNVIIGKEYLSSIENRLKLVEGRLLSLESHKSTGLPNSGIPVTPPNGSAQSEQLETASLRDESSENAEIGEDSIDAMGAVTFGPEEDCAFFGPSSNIAFIRHLSRAVARLSHDSQPWRPSPADQNPVSFTGAFFNTSRPTSPAPTSLDTSIEEVNIYALPPSSVSRELLRRYFSNTGLLFPYIHEKSFMDTFEQASKDNFKGVRRIWLALLNIMFAHAIVHIITRHTSPRGDGLSTTGHAVESEIYYKRAAGLCSEQIAKGTGTSIEFVQFLLLVGQYLQGTQKSVQVWKTHGLAVRAAFQLGLHSSDLSKMFNPLEQEIRKKTWFGCVILDRTMSMTFGRPPSIPESYVQVDLPVLYSNLDEDTPQETKEILSIAFFNGTITLYRLLYTIIELLYGNNLACSFSSSAVDTVSHVYKIENQLSEWQSNLPPEMKLITTEDIAPDHLPPEDESAEEAWRQLRLRFILTLRYTNIRILLHRTVLVKYLEQQENPTDSQNMSLLQQVGTLNIQIAIKSAKDLICLVHHAVKYSAGRSKWDLLGAWWFSLYYTFNAALILGACILIHIDHHSSGNQLKMQMPDTIEDMSSHLGMAIEALHDLDCNNRMVARCRDYLEQLVQVVQTLALGQGLLRQTNGVRAGFSPIPPFEPVSDPGNYGLLSGAPIVPNNGMLNNKHSPLGMELGEFMLDGDFDFLNNHIFAFNRALGP